MYRVGLGHDTHLLVKGRPLILAGVRIESEFGAVGHSDADVITHAIIDAILGALSEGDLGSHFPDSDEKWKDANSLDLLDQVVELAAKRGYQVVNVDATVMLEKPKLESYKESMRLKLSEKLCVPVSAVSIKAKTGEGIGPIGEGKAVSADAVVLLKQSEEAV